MSVATEVVRPYVLACDGSLCSYSYVLIMHVCVCICTYACMFVCNFARVDDFL